MKQCDCWMPGIDDEEAGPFLEGGDVLVYHKQVFVGNSGYASNEAGVVRGRRSMENVP